MNEDAVRKALRRFFKEYSAMAKKLDALVTHFAEETPIAKEELPRALELFEEELNKADLPNTLKIILNSLLRTSFEKPEKPEYVT